MEWSIRIIEFNFTNFTFKSKAYELIKPIQRKKDVEMTEDDVDFKYVEMFWMNNGNDIMLACKKRLLIFIQSLISINSVKR